MSRGRMTAAGGLSLRRRLYVRGVPPENPVPGADHLLLQPAQLGGDAARAESTLRNQRLRLNSQNRVAVSQLGSFFTVFLVALSTSILSFPTPLLFVFSQGCAAAASPCCGPDIAVVFTICFITGQWEERRAVIGLHGHAPRPPLAADTPPGGPAPTAPAGGGGPARGGGSGGDRGGDMGGGGRRGAAQKPRGVAVAAAWEHRTWKREEDLRPLLYFPETIDLKQGVTKRCRLSLRTNRVLVYESKCGGRGGEAGAGSQPMCTAVTLSQNKLWRSTSIFNL